MDKQFYDFEGVVVEVGKTQEVGSNGFKKRELILEADPSAQYPSPVKFTFKKDNCAKLSAVKVGDKVKVRFALDGRRWDGPKGTQYFVDLTAFKVEQVAGADVPEPVGEGEAETVDYREVEDEMPF